MANEMPMPLPLSFFSLLFCIFVHKMLSNFTESHNDCTSLRKCKFINANQSHFKLLRSRMPTLKWWKWFRFPAISNNDYGNPCTTRVGCNNDVLFTFDLFALALRKKITFLQQDKRIIFRCLKSSISLCVCVCVFACLFVCSRLKSNVVQIFPVFTSTGWHWFIWICLLCKLQHIEFKMKRIIARLCMRLYYKLQHICAVIYFKTNKFACRPIEFNPFIGP